MGPCTLMADTMSRFTLPTSTMRAMSSVSASVTRSPLRNSVSLPSRSISSPIWGPPPWTTTGNMPTARMRTTSSANEASASPGSSAPSLSALAAACNALPPYLTTTIFSQKRRM